MIYIVTTEFSAYIKINLNTTNKLCNLILIQGRNLNSSLCKNKYIYIWNYLNI